MKTLSAGEANRRFSSVLREVLNGETVIVTSRGKPVAAIGPAKQGEALRRAAKQTLLKRLHPQPATGKRNWLRGDLYADSV
jgi:prevent-host-death family protein